MAPRLTTYCSVRIDELFEPPADWRHQVMSLASRAAMTVHLTGNSPDCREDESGQEVVYSVVTGDVIAREISWLDEFYRSFLARYVSSIAGRAVQPSASKRHGVNINVLNGTSGRYEWHVDPSPFAAVLFVTGHPKGDGGELALRSGHTLLTVLPAAGLVVIFEGRRIEHAVLPLQKDAMRVSVPMLYYNDGEPQYFPRELDEYLYGR